MALAIGTFLFAAGNTPMPQRTQSPFVYWPVLATIAAAAIITRITNFQDGNEEREMITCRRRRRRRRPLVQLPHVKRQQERCRKEATFTRAGKGMYLLPDGDHHAASGAPHGALCSRLVVRPPSREGFAAKSCRGRPVNAMRAARWCTTNACAAYHRLTQSSISRVVLMRKCEHEPQLAGTRG